MNKRNQINLLPHPKRGKHRCLNGGKGKNAMPEDLKEALEKSTDKIFSGLSKISSPMRHSLGQRLVQGDSSIEKLTRPTRRDRIRREQRPVS